MNTLATQPPTDEHFRLPAMISDPKGGRIYRGDIIVIQGYTVIVTKTGSDEGMLIEVPTMDRYSDATFSFRYDPEDPKPPRDMTEDDKRFTFLDLTRGRFYITESDLDAFLKWTHGHSVPWSRWGGSV